MVTVPLRLTLSIDDETKQEKMPKRSSSESSSEESSGSEESLPDLEKEMKEQILQRGASNRDSHVCNVAISSAVCLRFHPTDIIFVLMSLRTIDFCYTSDRNVRL